HGSVEGEEIGILVVGLRKNPVALGVALTADLLALGIGFGEQHRDVAIGARADFLGALRALGAELGGFALALGLHPLIHRLAVLLGQIGTPDSHVDHGDAVA